MSAKDKPAGFVPLRSIAAPGAPDPGAALAEIRQIYFKTSRRTIEHDFAHAIALLKGLPDEETRARAHVYMEGLAEMQREWLKSRNPGASGAGKKKRAPNAGRRSSGER